MFGASQQAAAGQLSAVAPVVLGSNVDQSLIENAIIEAQLISSPYGDSPLAKLLPPESIQKSDLPNPTRYFVTL